MKGQPCGVMPGKTNMGKEANPVKDDNGMNKQNNDIVAPEGLGCMFPLEENLEMMVSMQMGKALLLKPTVLDLTLCDKNFGRNERDANTEHVHNHIRSSFVANNAKGLGPKVWSESHKAKIADRTSLHDILQSGRFICKSG
ncbi:hypothetical protein ACE6H2_006059 [Prunus campanulata]